ncbi:AraC family transcriptional regulator ligand-binding domain-containing protein [Marinobacter caseinilyticus]|uniref:AraC family transcriptional regulator ligand-binding domain-containing protein n=1 Tax=Marinobacter caseinilyticus TaxID=2692195 RepID=UPI00140E20B9|nr:AraC family transcriptional regulator ligand-binding domain-containing protein [Marinobacter caseinilyticus]
MKNLTFSSHYARAILYGLEKSGGRADELLVAHGIDPAMIRPPKARVPTDQFIRLFRLAWRELVDKFMDIK